MSIENLQIYAPFGPKIAKTKIPEQTIENLNIYFEKLINDKKKLDEQDYGHKLAGNVTKEIKIEEEVLFKSGWIDFLAKATRKYVKICAEKEITKFNIIDSWIVSQFKNEYNPTYWHGGHISGAGFLKLPNSLGQTVQNNKMNVNGHLQFIHGSKQFLSKSIFDIKPKVGDFYIFPNFLMHHVFPFSSTDEERRSISFNTNIDENIYNVYI